MRISDWSSDVCSSDDIRAQRCFTADWLRAHGMPASHRNLKLTAGRRTRGVLDAVSTARASWNGHNASGWKRDILAVNGFDRSEEHTSELQSIMRISYAVFCLKKKKQNTH